MMDSNLPGAQLFGRDAPAFVAAVPPPPGVTQDFINPPIAAANAPILVGVGVALAGLLVVMRFYTKGYLLRRFGAEDVTILLAFICSTVTSALILEGRKYGTGKHIWGIPVTTLVPRWGQIVIAAVVVYCPAMMFAKIAVLLCYLRISPVVSFRISVYVMIGIVVAYNLALMLSLIFACHPIAKNWDATILTGSCINRPAAYLANGVLNIITDFGILLLPIPMIRNLHMPVRQKILLAAFFTVGSLACIVSIIRISTLVPTLHNPDQTWVIADPGNWIIVEMNLAVSCGCLSVIRPFLRHHFPLLVGETGATGAKKYNKAKPSDYFSIKRTPISGSGRDHDPTGSKAQLSHADNRALGSWDADADAVGYSQDVKAEGGMGVKTGRYEMEDDLELGELGGKKGSGPGRGVSGSPAAGIRSGVASPKGEEGIMKTVEIDVNR